MHPSRVHSWYWGLVELMACVSAFLSFMCFSERRRARCKDQMALSYWPTSMHSAALLFNLCAKILREFSGSDDDGED